MIGTLMAPPLPCLGCRNHRPRRHQGSVSRTGSWPGSSHDRRSLTSQEVVPDSVAMRGFSASQSSCDPVKVTRPELGIERRRAS